MPGRGLRAAAAPLESHEWNDKAQRTSQPSAALTGTGTARDVHPANTSDGGTGGPGSPLASRLRPHNTGSWGGARLLAPLESPARLTRPFPGWKQPPKPAEVPPAPRGEQRGLPVPGPGGSSAASAKLSRRLEAGPAMFGKSGGKAGHGLDTTGSPRAHLREEPPAHPPSPGVRSQQRPRESSSA